MTFPIQPNLAWDIRDSSKLDDFILCRRYYFFRHILGWQLDMPAHDLHFGSCYHYAREHQLLHGYNDIQGAYNAFIVPYREVFPEESDVLFSPKTPAAVRVALEKFQEERQSDLSENEVVEIDGQKMTEISGAVPVDEGRVLHYRMDSIMRRKSDGKIFSWDHKTTAEKWLNSRQWEESFHLGLQNGTYTHCLYCMFPIEDVLGIEFCGTGFAYLKRGSANRSAGYHASFRRVPAFKTPDQMNVWLWNIVDLLDQLDMEMDRLFRCKEEDTVLMSFPMNPKSCSAYRGCQFHDFCLSWSNPLQRCYEPPLGFKEEFWDPSKMETTVKKDLTWKK